MKNQLYNIFIILCAFTFLSCDKDDETTIMTAPTAPVLSVSTTSSVLKSEEAETTNAMTFSWFATGYGFNADVVYTLQLDKAGNNFANAAEFTLKDRTRTSNNNIAGWASTVTAYTLDSLLSRVGLTTEAASEAELRLKSVTTGAVSEPVYSNPVSITITPYRDVVESAPVLSSSVTSFNNSNTAPVNFSWTATDYSLENEVTYILEFDTENSFTDSKKYTMSDATEGSFSVADFVAIATGLGIEIGSTGEVMARVKSYQAGSFTDTALSNIVSIETTPFVLTKSLYVPGAHQGWSPATAPQIYSLSGDEKYEGYVFFGDAGNMFKLTSHPDWDHTNYGSGGPGMLSTTGDNLTVTDAGYYFIQADLNALTWSAEERSWGVIGSATPTGWDSDTDLVYDPADQKLKVTLNLVAGELKFRANDDWGVNYGDNAADLILDRDGANITVAEEGEYEIILDFTDPEEYTYSLIKK